jgi:hypothetical protein
MWMITNRNRPMPVTATIAFLPIEDRTIVQRPLPAAADVRRTVRHDVSTCCAESADGRG